MRPEDIIGGAGEDFLAGGTLNESLFGGNGADYLAGGEGNDRLIGGSEGDTFFGQGGADTFVIRGGTNWIMDFDAAEGDRFEGLEWQGTSEQVGLHLRIDMADDAVVWFGMDSR